MSLTLQERLERARINERIARAKVNAKAHKYRLQLLNAQYDAVKAHPQRKTIPLENEKSEDEQFLPVER